MNKINPDYTKLIFASLFLLTLRINVAYNDVPQDKNT